MTYVQLSRVESGMDNYPLRSAPNPNFKDINVFNIHTYMDNPNPIIGGCGVGYGIGEM